MNELVLIFWWSILKGTTDSYWQLQSGIIWLGRDNIAYLF